MRRLLAGLGILAALAAPAAQARLPVETFDRAWTIIRDTHFDKTMNGVDWTAVQKELRPRAAAAASDGELRAVIRDMLGRLGQSHFALIPSGGDSTDGTSSDLSGWAGFTIRLLDGSLVVTHVEPGGPGHRAGVRPGWIVAAIDGTPVARLLGTLTDSMPQRLRDVEAWRLGESRLRGAQGSRVRVSFKDGASRDVQVAIERQADSGEPARVGNLPTMVVRVTSDSRTTPGGAPVGVIGFNVWMPAVDRLFQDAIDKHRKAAGIILDLRGNPGGLAAMLMGISGHFVNERKPLGVMKTRDTELKFTSNPRLVNAAGERVEPYAGPLAILVDAMTGSASECFAGGMQSIGRARVFGQTSMGQALPAVFDRLPNGDVLIHAYADFVTADGTRLEGRGVVPDEQVPLERADLLAGRDRTLERALQWIDAAGGR